jgi:hypothetical protein
MSVESSSAPPPKAAAANGQSTASATTKNLANKLRPPKKDLLKRSDAAVQKYHVTTTILSLVMATLIILTSYSNQYLKTPENLRAVQNYLGEMQNYGVKLSGIMSSFVSNIGVVAAEYSSSSDDYSEDSSDDDTPSNNPYHCLVKNPNGSCRTWSNVQHFINDFGTLETKWASCNTDYDESNDDAEEVAVEHSLYQKVIFEENLVVDDKCLWLDNTMQQCSTYRPHYHEPFVHLSAAYTDVKRVVFVGGGDSMLLHEVLKYPSLELVLGLELDQKVTRNSFEHFKTQPHFDDEKVQWWFGDGAKSLTLLPREYFGTFDLVLLDLSETVMSMTVTEGLDVFGAMKLLLSDTGIMVKNDFGYLRD